MYFIKKITDTLAQVIGVNECKDGFSLFDKYVYEKYTDLWNFTGCDFLKYMIDAKSRCMVGFVTHVEDVVSNEEIVKTVKNYDSIEEALGDVKINEYVLYNDNI